MRRYHKVVDVYVDAETEDQANTVLGEFLSGGYRTVEDGEFPGTDILVQANEPWDDVAPDA